MITPLIGKPTSLSMRPAEWLDLTNGSIIHFCPQAPPPTIDPGLLQKYDAFKYSLDLSLTFNPLPLTDTGKSSNLNFIFPMRGLELGWGLMAPTFTSFATNITVISQFHYKVIFIRIRLILLVRQAFSVLFNDNLWTTSTIFSSTLSTNLDCNS